LQCTAGSVGSVLQTIANEGTYEEDDYLEKDPVNVIQPVKGEVNNALSTGMQDYYDSAFNLNAGIFQVGRGEVLQMGRDEVSLGGVRRVGASMLL
jgi:hypothetical protein